MPNEPFTHLFLEAGNGYPAKRDWVYDEDSRILRVVSVSPIHTRQWQANHVYLECYLPPHHTMDGTESPVHTCIRLED